MKVLCHWVFVVVCSICGGFLGVFIAEHWSTSRHDSIAEYTPRCPQGYFAWEIQEYLPTGPINRDGDSILIFEKSVRSGCRLFATSSDTPEMIKESASSDPVVDTIYHSTILGRIDLRKNKIAFLDTTRWTTTCKKQNP